MDVNSRRGFVRSSALGIGAGVVGSSATRVIGSESELMPHVTSGRQVWIASICQHNLRASSPQDMCSKILGRMNEALPMHPDVICLPECFHVANVHAGSRPSPQEIAEEPLGPISSRFAQFASQNACNVICPIHIKGPGCVYNSAIVLDRQGCVVGEYRKINPTDAELSDAIACGPIEPPVFDLDVGRIGVQICFDINWHDNWRRLKAKGAEIVFWPSAFAGGQMLNTLASINKYFVVSSTRIQSTKIVDPLGDEVASTGRFGNWLCAPVNLDVDVIQGWQDINKLDAVRAKYGRGVNVTLKHDEAWAMVESLGSKSINEIFAEFKIETSFEMLERNAQLQAASRREAGTHR